MALADRPRCGHRGTVDDWAGFPVPRRIGSYTALAGYQAGENVFIAIEGLGFAATGGFAYPPTGGTIDFVLGDLGVSSFSTLGDGWYSWTVTLD